MASRGGRVAQQAIISYYVAPAKQKASHPGHAPSADREAHHKVLLTVACGSHKFVWYEKEDGADMNGSLSIPDALMQVDPPTTYVVLLPDATFRG